MVATSQGLLLLFVDVVVDTSRGQIGFREVKALADQRFNGFDQGRRAYQTTIPGRSEMLNIIRTAFDRGVTFFDADEAYGPFEVERILGESVASSRDEYRWRYSEAKLTIGLTKRAVAVNQILRVDDFRTAPGRESCDR